MNLTLYGMTHTGLVRNHNEDNFWIDAEMGAAIVSDGMGGLAAGETASAITVESFRKVVRSRLPKAVSIKDVMNILSNSIGLANQEVRVAIRSVPSRHSMGATTVCACFWKETFVVASIGDSRGYLIQNGIITRLTKDDSLVQRLMDDGLIGEDQARVHPQKNLITRFIGNKQDALPAITTVEAEPGYRILLCTDGLNSMLTDEEILVTVDASNSIERACGSLIEKTLECGAPDNVTVVLFETF